MTATLLETVDSLNGLTVRQREVVVLIVQGLTYLEIGEVLKISERMAKQHSLDAQAALGCRNRHEIVRLVWAQLAVSAKYICPQRPS